LSPPRKKSEKLPSQGGKKKKPRFYPHAKGVFYGGTEKNKTLRKGPNPQLKKRRARKQAKRELLKVRGEEEEGEEWGKRRRGVNNHIYF